MNSLVVEINELAKIIVHNAKHNAQMHASELSPFFSHYTLRVRSAIEYDVVDHCVNVADLIVQLNNQHGNS